MRRSLVFVFAAGWLLAAASVSAQTSTSPTTPTPGVTMPDVTTPARDVFVLTCVFDLRTQPAPLVVLDASGSGGTSVIEAGAPCAQALGTLVSAGFAIVTALPSFDGGAQYTLVR